MELRDRRLKPVADEIMRIFPAIDVVRRSLGRKVNAHLSAGFVASQVYDPE